MTKRFNFPKDFIWGTATSSYQIEGACNEDGKGESIWDRFSHIPGMIDGDDTGDVACDHYHLYEEDIKLLKDLGIQAYRFSISWPRIFPDGKGEINRTGIDFYKRLINLLIENDIKPVVTLYHWDLPQKLQEIGGWANREITYWFEQYAIAVFKEFGELVPIWITHNEPWVVAFLGHWKGIFAPGHRDFSIALQVSHHLMLSHGMAVNAYRKMGFKGEIGISLNMDYAYAASDSSEDQAAANRFLGFQNRWFADPILKGKYPSDIQQWYSSRVKLPVIEEDDLNIISTPVDFIGINNYYSDFVKFDKHEWPLELTSIKTGRDQTAMGWEIVPEGLYDLLMFLHREYPVKKLYITENGAAFNDLVGSDGKIIDQDRINYLQKHIEQANLLIKNGVNLAGYFLWSFIDNFEWASGYAKRFGIVHVDFETRKRTIKESGFWYKNVINNHGLD